ncbi:hypothetical protein [Brevibacillus sp. DP1.3A]|uniref:hypothetical protein n=1 Tax=Brevibacillus sp. DP1.3A TaxID=2738867 RepID=UPI00156AF53B|nr:hypothetical protein [Brevibacillus sp. DP1.3A]MED1915334.1 hypothetical protein [Bacillus thuringiensis]UED75129.1 hypothetical protein HP399_001045 [Brevibacillus sp. DP1.3A]
MGQLIAVILNIMVMLLVPLGLLQVHTVVQARNELLEVSSAATKYVSNHGGTSEANLQQEVRALIASELREKKFSVSDQDLSVSVTRTRSLDPVLWSHEDEFVVELAIPYPRFTSWIPMPADSLQVQRLGTVNIMDYDL